MKDVRGSMVHTHPKPKCPKTGASSYDLSRKVGPEASRSYREKCLNGFFDTFMIGNGLDIGPKGSTDSGSILPTAIPIDLDYPGYDGICLPFEEESQDYIYSSHCLEHIDNSVEALQDWYRVLKYGGHIVIVVPHQFVYEKKKELPSRWAPSHKRFYTPATLLKEIELVFLPNSYRIEYMRDNTNHETLHNTSPDNHSNGPYEIELVVKKMKPPAWELV